MVIARTTLSKPVLRNACGCAVLTNLSALPPPRLLPTPDAENAYLIITATDYICNLVFTRSSAPCRICISQVPN